MSALEHAGGEVPHDWLDLHSEVEEHLIGLPTTKEADCVGIDVGTQKGHCTGGAEGPSRNIAWVKTKLGPHQGAR